MSCAARNTLDTRAKYDYYHHKDLEVNNNLFNNSSIQYMLIKLESHKILKLDLVLRIDFH